MYPFDINALPNREGFYVFDTVTSTNTQLSQAARGGAPSGTVYIAESQTGGRGRRGRSFASPPGTGLYLSMLLRTDMPQERIGRMTCAAAVAMRSAIISVTGLKPGIKWVNDLLLEGKKVCGILCESVAGTDAYIVGVGVNVFTPEGGFPDGIAQVAGALLSEARPGVRESIAYRFAVNMDGLFREQFERVPQLYAEGCITVGKPVNVISASGVVPAEAIGLDGECHLIVRYGNGATEVLSSGEVSVRGR